jgi:hypothetical protein
MMYRAIVMALGALPVYASCSFAETRTPLLGSGSIRDMLPPSFDDDKGSGNIPLLSPVASDSFRIVNFGNKALSLSYWDGESSWKTITVGAGGQQDWPCPKCNGTVTIAFNNGKEDQRFNVPTGASYQLSWSQQSQTWKFTGLINH